MNFALTSIALGSINVTNYLQRFDQRQPAVPTVVNQFELSVYFHNEQTHFWNQINSSYSICKFGLDDFIVQDGCVVFSDDDSCVRFDASTNAIWLSADVAGSAPLWYAVEGDHVIITTDLLLAYHSGFTEPTALGPGQTMQLDLNTNELVDLYFRRSHVCTQSLSTSPRTVIPEVYSRYVLQRGITSLKSSLERSASPKQQSNGVSTLPKRLYTVEVDRMDSSSLLLDCMLDAMHVNRAVRDSRPLVTDSAVVDHPLFQAVMGNPI